jgi:hypothetical protein
MTDALATRTVAPDEAAWGLQPVGCTSCDRTFLAPSAHVPCPCGGGALEPATVRIPTQPPEQLIPVQVDRDALERRLRAHLRRGWLDERFDPAALARSATLVWWPRWLVDATLTSPWTAEIGFNYEARSSVEVLHAGAWRSKERVEPRIRWEPRGGTLARRYDNVRIDARSRPTVLAGLADDDAPVTPFRADALGDGAVLPPDLGPAEVWAKVEPAFRARAAEDLHAAAAGQHARDVHLAPTYADTHWTVALRPVWWAAARGGDGRIWPVLVDGASGRAWSPRPASMGRAWAWCAGLAAAGVALLALTALVAVIGLVLLPLLVIVPFTGIAGAALLMAAAAPPIVAWSRNEAEKQKLGALP